MGNITLYLLFVIGLVFVIKGSDWFIDSAVGIAKAMKIPQVIIGATLVSLCTTLPEFFVSTTAAVHGDTSVALGNAFGSIACNTGLILAMVILISKPELKDRKDILNNGILLMLLIVALFVCGLVFGEINRIMGILLIAVLFFYMYTNTKRAKIYSKNTEEDSSDFKITPKTVILFILGVGFVILGSNLMVNNGISIAETLGVPSSVIGFTVLAVGTSLPELTTAIASLVKKAHGVAIGNVIGANILNIILVTATSAVINPIQVQAGNGVPGGLMILQIPLIFLIVAVLLFNISISKDRIPRICGLIMLVLYIVFALITCMGADFPISSIAKLFEI